MNSQIKQHRFKLIHTMSGQTVARADNLTDLRNMVDQANANYFTLHDLQEGSFAGASIIFKEVSAENQQIRTSQSKTLNT